MKKTLFVLCLSIVCLLSGCSSGDNTAYKDLTFGMTLEDVRSKGYLADNNPVSSEDMISYRCAYSDFAGCQYEKAELNFQNDKLVRVYFYNSTLDPEVQKEFSRKVTDYLTSLFGPSKLVNKCDGWRDEKRTYILYVHSDFDDNMNLKYINELAIYSNDLYNK